MNKKDWQNKAYLLIKDRVPKLNGFAQKRNCAFLPMVMIVQANNPVGQNTDWVSPLIVTFLFLFAGFGVGYIIRSRRIMRRRRRARLMKEKEQFSKYDRLYSGAPKKDAETNETIGSLAAIRPDKEIITEPAKLTKENSRPLKVESNDIEPPRAETGSIGKFDFEKRPSNKKIAPSKTDDSEKSPVVVEQDGHILPGSSPKDKPGVLLYFPNPNSEGNFRQVDGSRIFKEGASIYKFKLITPDVAKFEFCHHQSSLALALNNRGLFILSVADEANDFNPAAKQLATVKFGVASFDGTLWKVTSKLKISYV